MSKTVDKIIFEAEVQGTMKQILVRKPNMVQQREGQKIYNRAFNDAISSGALLRAKLDDFMRDQNMWDDKKQEELGKISEEIISIEKSIAKGGIKLSEAKKLAIKLRGLRLDLRDMIAQRTELDVHTAEGQADNARFNYWVSSCLVYNDNQKPVFNNMDDYLNNQAEDYAVQGASKLASLLYNLSENFDDSYEENKFLREFGFADSENRLVNKEGKLVDETGRLINEKGHYIDEDGNRVDKDGLKLDDDGNYSFDRSPFLDDDNNPIVSQEEDKEEDKEEESSSEKADSKDEETVESK